MSTLEVNTVKPISGSNTITLGESGDTIALASGASQTLAVMTPAFEAYPSSDTNIASSTSVKGSRLRTWIKPDKFQLIQTQEKYVHRNNSK